MTSLLRRRACAAGLALLIACGNEPTPPPEPAVPAYASVAAGARHSCGLTTAGAAYCWGDNADGELGDGSTVSTLAPVSVTGGLSFTVVGVAGQNNCGLTTDGAAYCWGSDFYGAIGAGALALNTCTTGTGESAPCSDHPVPVAGGRRYTAISVGWGPVCGLDENGAAYCWGDNAFGTLGIGADTATLETCGSTLFVAGPCSRTPLPVAGGLQFKTLGGGTWHVCGLTASGAAYCWGDNRFGQLGIGFDTAPDRCDSVGPCRRTPVLVSGGLTFTALSVFYAHSCGLATDGIWYCWGENNYGQLGNGTSGPEICTLSSGVDYPCSRQPVAIASGMSFTRIFGGLRYSCGLTAAAVPYCWGYNADSQLGDGTTTSTRTPVAVAGGLRFASVSPYAYHTCGLTTDGVPYCWGRNTWGNLGDGTTNNSSVPVRVSASRAGAGATMVRSRDAQGHGVQAVP